MFIDSYRITARQLKLFQTWFFFFVIINYLTCALFTPYSYHSCFYGKLISSKNPKNVNKRKHLHNNFLSDVDYQNRSFLLYENLFCQPGYLNAKFQPVGSLSLGSDVRDVKFLWDRPTLQHHSQSNNPKAESTHGSLWHPRRNSFDSGLQSRSIEFKAFAKN